MLRLLRGNTSFSPCRLQRAVRNVASLGESVGHIPSSLSWLLNLSPGLFRDDATNKSEKYLLLPLHFVMFLQNLKSPLRLTSPLLPHGNLPRRSVQLLTHPLLDLRPVGRQLGVLQDHRVLLLRPPSTARVRRLYISPPPCARTLLGLARALLRRLAGRRWCRLERLLQLLQLFVRGRRRGGGSVKVEGGFGL